MKPPGFRKLIGRLDQIRARFDNEASVEKLQLLRTLDDTAIQTASHLVRLHRVLCYIRAFPDTLDHHRIARAMLSHFEMRVQSLSRTELAKTDDSGICGTKIYYSFSYAVAVWLARKSKNKVTVSWGELDDTERLDELLELLLLPAEGDYFDSGYVSSQEWLALASGNGGSGDFNWLLAQLHRAGPKRIVTQLYDAIDLPLTWNLSNTRFSMSENVFAVSKIEPRKRGMRKPGVRVKAEILRPIRSLRKQKPEVGAKLIDVAMASLAVRHRETYHFNFANSQEVYIADVGEGINIAVFGLQPNYRFPLECTMGFLILANGVPIGYGGSSIVFRQANTGLNIFDEYRGSEAAFLWVQVMRVFHQLVGCSCFVANPYQVGQGNPEALKSGAFWFYYRLGYRPVVAEIRELASRELKKSQSKRSYRSSIQTLRTLSSCDMHLRLPGARAREFFAERWIETSSLLATRQLAAAGGGTRQHAAKRVATKLASDLGLRSREKWSADQKRAFENIAPIVVATDPSEWPAEAKRTMRQLLQLKGGPDEARYARLLGEHLYFLDTLKARCLREE